MEAASVHAAESVEAGLVMRPVIEEKITAPKFRYEVECLDKDGNLKWVEDVTNLVTTQGGNDLIDKYFKGSAYPAAWYMGLAGVGTKALTDTGTTHAAWSEVNPYTGNRPAITFGTTAAKSNTATVVSYACNGSATVAGAYVITTNTGATGILYSVSDFSASRAVVNGDTLNVTLTCTV